MMWGGVVVVLLVGTVLAGDGDWAQFRGPAAGITREKGFPTRWGTTENVVWKADVPGLGWSSPIIAGDRVFLTTVASSGKVEEPKKGLYFGGERTKPPADPHRWLVLCHDFRTGQKLWERTAHEGVPEITRHVKNSYASETPVTDGKRVYAYFGNVGVYCYTLDGEPVWSKKLGSYKTRFGWGTAASPVVYKDRLYIVNDNEEKSFLVALDAATGQEVWRVDRDEKSNWVTPFVWENEKRTELVTAGSNRVRSYDLDGKLLWELKGMSVIAIPTPFARHGLLYVSSGYVMDKTKPVYAIRPGAAGDISLQENETKNEFIAWSLPKAGPYNVSPLVFGDYLYILYDQGFLACYDAKTGAEVYPKQRIDTRAAAFTASPWAYDGKVFCHSEDGDTFIIQAGPEFKVLGKNSLEETCLATPALSRGSLVIRTQSKLYRIGNSR
jgi:outer membrane protein assembly factor BamB